MKKYIVNKKIIHMNNFDIIYNIKEKAPP